MSLYRYWLTVTRVHDGDTISGSIDLGFYLAMGQAVRLGGINAPEITGTTAVAGKASTIALMGLIGFVHAPARLKGAFGVPGDYVLADGATPPVLVVETAHPKAYEKYGRVLGTLYASEASSTSIDQAMIDGGWAIAYP